MLAECALCQSREAEAFALMDECVDQLATAGYSAEREEAITWRGELHLWLGQYGAALADLGPGMASGFPYALIWGGAAHLLLGRHERALILLDRAVQAVPGDAEAYLWRGEAHERLGQLGRAVGDFDRAIALNGTSVWACVGRALARARLGDAAGTIADFTALPARTLALFEWKTSSTFLFPLMSKDISGIRKASSESETANTNMGKEAAAPARLKKCGNRRVSSSSSGMTCDSGRVRSRKRRT